MTRKSNVNIHFVSSFVLVWDVFEHSLKLRYITTKIGKGDASCITLINSAFWQQMSLLYLLRSFDILCISVTVRAIIASDIWVVSDHRQAYISSTSSPSFIQIALFSWWSAERTAQRQTRDENKTDERSMKNTGQHSPWNITHSIITRPNCFSSQKISGLDHVLHGLDKASLTISKFWQWQLFHLWIIDKVALLDIW